MDSRGRDLEEVNVWEQQMIAVWGYVPTSDMQPLWWPKSKLKVECECNPPFNYFCAKCDVWREAPEHAWRPNFMTSDEDKEPELAKRRKKKAQQQKQKSSGTYTSGSYQNYQNQRSPGTTTNRVGTLQTCRHYNDSLVINGVKFYASSCKNARTKDDVVPDWGLYCDWMWKPWWRAEHIDWDDYSIPRVDEIALEQLIVAVEKAQLGLKVEIGCIGGHGRTGTALAAIGVILGMGHKESIAHVKTQYCDKAIETGEQEWWVSWVDHVLNGIDLAEKPPAHDIFGWGDYGSYTGGGKYDSYSSYATSGAKANTVNTPNACLKADHWEMWLDGAASCSRCSYYEADAKTFMAGGYVGHFNQPGEAPGCLTITAEDGVAYRVPLKAGKHTGNYNGNQCKCDGCRYIRKGYGAFIRPVAVVSGLEHDFFMHELEKASLAKGKQTKSNVRHQGVFDGHNVVSFVEKIDGEKPYSSTIAVDGKVEMRWTRDSLEEAEKSCLVLFNNTRKRLEKDVEAEEEWVLMAMPNGDIQKVLVHESFEPKPPVADGIERSEGEISDEYVYRTGLGWVWSKLLLESR